MGTYDPVGFSLQKQLNGHVAHLGSIDTVPSRGSAAALNMSKYRHPGIQIDGVFDLGRNIGGRARALRDNDHVMSKTIKPGLTDFFNHVSFKINGFLRNQHRSGAASQTHIHGKVSGIASHHLHDGAPLVGLHGVAQLVDTLNSGIGSSVEANTVVGAADVIVDGTGDADDINAVFAEGSGTPECSVTANGYNAVQAQEFTGGNGLALAFFGHKLLAPGSIKDCTAAVDRVSDTLFIQTDNVAVNETVPAPADAVAFQAVVNRGSDNCTDAGVHAGCVTAAGQDANSFYAHEGYLLSPILLLSFYRK